MESEKLKGFYECPLIRPGMCPPYADFLLSPHEVGRCRKCGKKVRLIPKGALIDFGDEVLCNAYKFLNRERVEICEVEIAHNRDTTDLDRQYFVG